MLSGGDNETLTRVGPGTPMGDLMRHYWIPACLSSELEADDEPMRLLLLGERLIAFRDSTGRIGIMDHRCAHRGASLFFGRNEASGLRCVYHGWKYDVEGNCVDMPNVPPSQDFKRKIKAKAYRVVERAGLVWTYMGPRAEAPPLPEIEALMLPEAERVLRVHQRECNWLQSLEGDIDTSHFGFLHIGSVDVNHVDPDTLHRWAVVDRAPEYKVRETEWGTMYCAFREAEPGALYYRFAHFLLPFFTFSPNGTFKDLVLCTVNVPMDDEHTMTYSIGWAKRTAPLETLKTGEAIPGLGRDMKYLPRTNGWYGRWRLEGRRDNDYFIDREAQRHSSYTGIQGIGRQDQAVVESMGTIVDRSLEHLAPSDRMITATRRRLLKAARELRDEKKVPATVDGSHIYRLVRGGSFVASASLDWLDAYARNLREATRPLAQDDMQVEPLPQPSGAA